MLKTPVRRSQFTASFSPVPGLNVGCTLVLIFMGSPVRGLRPVEAFRFVTEKVPNPTRRTSSPRFNAPEIVSKTDSTALPASVRLRPVASATEPISSCLFMPVGTPTLDVDGDSDRKSTRLNSRH